MNFSVMNRVINNCTTDAVFFSMKINCIIYCLCDINSFSKKPLNFFFVRTESNKLKMVDLSLISTGDSLSDRSSNK